jgi:hypothetical protein
MMPHIKGISRQQLQVVRLEETVNQDHPVRFIDTFVHRINLEGIGFREVCQIFQIQNQLQIKPKTQIACSVCWRLFLYLSVEFSNYFLVVIIVSFIRKISI